MDRVTESVIVVFYCIVLLTTTCVLPLMDRVVGPAFTPSGISSTSSSGISPTYTSGVTVKDLTTTSYSYTTSGYESKAFQFPVDVVNPPLEVKYQFFPKNITRTKTVTSEYGRKETKLIKYEMPSEDSWLRVSIFDEKGNVVDESGYGRVPGDSRGLGNPEGKVSTPRSGEHTVEVRFNNMMGKFSF